MMRVMVVLLAVAFASTALAGDDFRFVRSYKRSSQFIMVVIELPMAAKVKCVIYNEEGEPLRVDEEYLDPPVDEMLFRTGEYTDTFDTIKCWAKPTRR